jgi:hypothetical protein
VKGIIARAVGVGTVRIIVKAADGEEIAAMLKNMLYVPEISRLTIGISASPKFGDKVIAW